MTNTYKHATIKSEAGETPIIKNEIPTTFAKGTTPIEKNIRVVDAQGNELEATYPKRAKGLVKQGRARFIDENTICLACPPDELTEDKIMEYTSNEQGAQITEESITAAAAEAAQQPAEPQTGFPYTEITEQAVLELLDRITGMAEWNRGALAKFASPIPDSTGDYYEAYTAYNAKVHAAMEVQRQTIQALLETAKQMLDYLQNKKSKSGIDPETFLSFVQETAKETGTFVDFAALWNQMRHG